MLVAIPFLALGFLIVLAHQVESSLRSASILAVVAWASLLVLITELLSLAHLFTVAGVLVAWLAVCGVAACLLYRASRLHGVIRFRRMELAVLRQPLVLGITGIIAIVGLNAVMAPPNGWDTMAYHMPRVVHWIQNGSVAHFATHYTPQAYQPPGAEFVIAQFQMLSGSDYLANMVQWLAMVGSIVAASLIAQRLGGSRHAQFFAAVFVATLPMGIAQASGSYTDYVATFWPACFAFYVVSTSQGEGKALHLLAAGVSLGLAMLTKYTAYLYAFPFLVWLAIIVLRRFRWRAWKQLGLVAVVALALNAGHYGRNLQLFHSPFGPARTGSYLVDAIGIRSLVSNLIRNLSFHFATPISRVNAWTVGVVDSLHSTLGMDANDPGTTLLWNPPQRGYDLSTAILGDEIAGNPIHLALVFAGGIASAAYARLRRNMPLMIYGSAVLAAYLVLCLLLKWERTGSRFQLAFFVLAAPLVAIALSEVLPRRVVGVIGFALIIFGLPWVLHNSLRPLVNTPDALRAVVLAPSSMAEEGPTVLETTRESLYFRKAPYMHERYIEAADYIEAQSCTDVGLLLYWSDVAEYPLWAMLRDRLGERVRVEHVAVLNDTRSKADADFEPCLVVALSYGSYLTDTPGASYHDGILEMDGQEYVQVLDASPEEAPDVRLVVFERGN